MSLLPAPLRPGYDIETNLRPESIFEFKLRLINALRAEKPEEIPPSARAFLVRFISEFK